MLISGRCPLFRNVGFPRVSRKKKRGDQPAYFTSVDIEAVLVLRGADVCI